MSLPPATPAAMVPSVPGQVPAALVVAGRAPAGAHPGLEPDRIGQHEIGAAHRRALGRPPLGEREQRRQDRRARMQHHAAHVGIVEIQHMPHLPVGERRIAQAEPQLAPEHGRLRPAAHLLQHLEQHRDGLVAAAGERAADPIHDPAARLMPRRLRQIAEPRRRQPAAQGLGQGDGIGAEVLVHGGGAWLLIVRKQGSNGHRRANERTRESRHGGEPHHRLAQPRVSSSNLSASRLRHILPLH